MLAVVVDNIPEMAVVGSSSALEVEVELELEVELGDIRNIHNLEEEEEEDKEEGVELHSRDAVAALNQMRTC